MKITDSNVNPAEVRCPGCDSTNLTEPDHEGLMDCRDCGTWFKPTDPAINSICTLFPVTPGFIPANGPHNDPPEEEVA